MSNVWGERIKLSIFGESHGPAIGIVIGGLPAGESVDEDEIRKEMQRRAPGNSELSTPRKEKDQVQILSGLDGRKNYGCTALRNNTEHKHALIGL